MGINDLRKRMEVIIIRDDKGERTSMFTKHGIFYNVRIFLCHTAIVYSLMNCIKKYKVIFIFLPSCFVFVSLSVHYV